MPGGKDPSQESKVLERAAAEECPVLEVRDLRTVFTAESGLTTPVDGVSLHIPCSQTVALVGESGCGKSVTALSIMRLIPQPPGKIVSGSVLLDDTRQCPPDGKHPCAEPSQVDLLRLSERRMRRIRGNRIAMIFQEPLVSLNPVCTVGAQIVEAIELHQPVRGKAAWDLAVEMLRKVEIPAPKQRARDYPHQMSGGMRQRAMIAMALSCRPSLLIADEPTTALDATIQLQIMDLLQTLQAETRMSILLIAHDLGVVARIADYVYVMYAGRIVEHGPTREILTTPLHPYTQGLLRCMPRPSERKSKLEVIPGDVPDPANVPPGCPFHPRCARSATHARERSEPTVAIDSPVGDAVLRRCVDTVPDKPSGPPELHELRPGHYVACWEAGDS
jgi:oligopeptide/dipeptide ABC transporter ATP-binding protein